MEHWFDALSRPHTRRTAVKTALVAGGALLLPFGRPRSASALDSEACIRPCLQLATAQQEQDDEQCARRFGVSSWAESAPLGAGAMLSSLRHERWTGCNAVGSSRFYESVVRCKYRPDCGDPGSYPGGSAPTPVPQPPVGGCDAGYLLCGTYCCDVSIATCVGCKGQPICCRNGGNCCGG